MGSKILKLKLQDYGIENWKLAYWNASPNDLIEQTLRRSQGTLSHNGTLCASKTGKFTGRSPKDRYIVKDSILQIHTVDWNHINKEYDNSDKFDQLEIKTC